MVRFAVALSLTALLAGSARAQQDAHSKERVSLHWAFTDTTRCARCKEVRWLDTDGSPKAWFVDKSSRLEIVAADISMIAWLPEDSRSGRLNILVILKDEKAAKLDKFRGDKIFGPALVFLEDEPVAETAVGYGTAAIPLEGIGSAEVVARIARALGTEVQGVPPHMPSPSHRQHVKT